MQSFTWPAYVAPVRSVQAKPARPDTCPRTPVRGGPAALGV